MADHTLVGKVGRVTCTILPGHTGEVMIEVRGGSEAFSAVANPDVTLTTNTKVFVIEYYPPRTVLVSPLRETDEQMPLAYGPFSLDE